MKKLLFLLITILFISCTNHQENMQAIGDFIVESVKELKELQLDSNIRHKEYNFNGQELQIYFDSTGKPVFVDKELNKLDYVIINIDDNSYYVKLENGKVKVTRK